jgi:Calcineurin-like phosphoesterase
MVVYRWWRWAVVAACSVQFASSWASQVPKVPPCHARVMVARSSITVLTEPASVNLVEPRAVKESLQFPALQRLQRLVSAGTTPSSPSLVLVVDVENVRGKSGFAYSHQDLLQRLEEYVSLWKATSNACDLDILSVVDHGSVPTGYLMPFGGLVFAGPTRKADDVMAQHVVPYFCSHEYTNFTNQQALVSHVVVVTADQDLIRRCTRQYTRYRHARALSKLAPCPALAILSPHLLLQDLDAMRDAQTMDALDTPDLPLDESVSSLPLDHHEHRLLNYEIQVGAQLLQAEAVLRSKKHITNKRRKKLQHQAHQIRERLVQVRAQSVTDQANGTVSLLDQITGFLDSNRRSSTLNFAALVGLSFEQKNALFAQWDRVRQSSQRKEQTGDRVILAEALRQRLETGTHEDLTDQRQQNDRLPGHPVHCFVDWVNDQHRQQQATIASGSFLFDRDRRTSRKAMLRQSLPTTLASSSERASSVGNDETATTADQSVQTSPLTDESPVPPCVVEEQVNISKSQPSSSSCLKVLVISDTHGFEEQLTPDQGTLPEADVLLHLGDFAIDDIADDQNEVRRAAAFAKFDSWLHRQPASLKIVLRGNHDPRHATFPVSGAVYVVQPMTFSLCASRPAPEAVGVGDTNRDENDNSMPASFSMLAVPFGKMPGAKAFPKSGCDIVASHEPPYQLLDKTYAGKHVGSEVLKRGLQRMTKGAQCIPLCCLCGHIHEGRGLVKHVFGTGLSKPDPYKKLLPAQETTVINAANANIGRATRLDYGPVLLHFHHDKFSKVKSMEVVQMDHQFTFLNQEIGNSDFFGTETVSTQKTEQILKAGRVSQVGELLLAVDLGLRTGLSLYNCRGRLLRYANFHFENVADLRVGAVHALTSWGMEANAVASPCLELNERDMSWSITRIAIEGGDPPLRDAWMEAIEFVEATASATSLLGLSGSVASGPKKVLYVRPEEWRMDLLNEKEKRSGEDAKAASRLIARQIIADYSVYNTETGPPGTSTGAHSYQHVGKLPTDAAESILLGYHVCRRLGWIQRVPPVRRFTNGSIIVPKPTTPPQAAMVLSFQE